MNLGGLTEWQGAGLLRPEATVGSTPVRSGCEHLDKAISDGESGNMQAGGRGGRYKKSIGLCYPGGVRNGFSDLARRVRLWVRPLTPAPVAVRGSDPHVLRLDPL